MSFFLFYIDAARIHSLLNYVFQSLSTVARSLPIKSPYYQMSLEVIANLPTTALMAIIKVSQNILH